MSILSLLCTAYASGLSREVYPQWTSDATMNFKNGPFKGLYSGGMVYDRLGKRSYQYISSIVPFAPASYIGTPYQWLNQSFFSNTGGMYMSSNNQTVEVLKGDGIGFEDIFYYLKFAKDEGKETLNGTVTQKFKFSLSEKDHFIYNVIPFVKGDKFLTPVRSISNTSAPALPGQPPQNQVVITTYRNLVVGDQQQQVFNKLNLTTVHNPPTCQSKKVINEETFDMYIFHPSTSYNISNQNLADLVGDTVFICADSNNTAVDHYELISLYSIKVNSNWGQYTMCNGYSPTRCTGSEKFYVGREGPYFLGDHAGQCTSHPETGTWWSLPEGGRCNTSTSILDGSCTWEIIEKRKTVNSTCVLKGNHLIDACKQDRRLPFPTASKILRSAFTETDPSKNGCPAL